MPRHPKYYLLQQIVRAVGDAGWSVFYLNTIDEHPFHLQIYHEHESYIVRIYIWNTTHGGASRDPNEFRIQITGVDSFEYRLSEKTLILGWWDEGQIFTGFDVRKHLGQLGASPSIQIRRESLIQAAVSGFSPYEKGNQELAIAFRPDFFIEYVKHLEQLHDFGQTRQDLDILTDLSDGSEMIDRQVPLLDQNRQRVIRNIRQALRRADFHNRVLQAYGFSCAICGIQLRLIDAAHIVPVANNRSTDETSNGLALCSLHHRAFDSSLLTVWDDYTVRVSEQRINRLREENRSNGVDSFINNLRDRILVPTSDTDRPNVMYLRLANEIRGWLND